MKKGPKALRRLIHPRLRRPRATWANRLLAGLRQLREAIKRRAKPVRAPIDQRLRRPRIRKASRLLAGLRQLLYSKPFRIAPAVWPSELLAALDIEAGAPKPAPSPPSFADARDFYRLIADAATGLWRVKKKMIRKGGTEPAEEMRGAYRHVESTLDALTGAQVEIRDHTGEKYVTGMALRVLAFQQTPAVQLETIEETIKPSVFYRDMLIQRGEVIVAIPVKTPAEQQTQREPGKGQQVASHAGQADNGQSNHAGQTDSQGNNQNPERGT